MEPTAEFAQLQLGFADQTQWRYEVIRPLVLFADRTAQQRAQETHTHPDTVRTLQRRFRQQGMRGLLPQVLLWVAGEQLRAVFENVVLAAYHCWYDWQDRKVKDIREDGLYQTRFASTQGSLIPLTRHDSMVVCRARSPRHRVPPRSPTPQLLLFEVAHAG